MPYLCGVLSMYLFTLSINTSGSTCHIYAVYICICVFAFTAPSPSNYDVGDICSRLMSCVLFSFFLCVFPFMSSFGFIFRSFFVRTPLI